MMSFFSKKYLIRMVFYSVISISAANCSIDEDVNNNLPFANLVLGKDSSALRFIVISDWGYNGSQNQRSVATQMQKIAHNNGSDFILTCGDNFQTGGTKGSENLDWKSNFEDIYIDSSLLVSWYPALGNHDYYGNPDVQVEYESIHHNWDMKSRYYSFVKDIDSANSIRFIVLDTPDLIEQFDNLSENSKFDTIVQYRWLEKVLSESNEKWTIVTGHHPIYSAGTYHGDTWEINIMIKPLLEKYDVDYYICGHDHHFEHSQDAHSNIEYIVTGTGGECRPVGFTFQTLFAMSEVGFTYMSVSENDAQFYFITQMGKIAYSYNKHKSMY